MQQEINVSYQTISDKTGFYVWIDIIRNDFRRNKGVYALAIPAILYYIIFKYIPMYGTIISFKEYSPQLGVLGSPWVGLKHYRDFFGGIFAGRVIKNTLLINFWGLVIGFPMPIILALLLNDLKNEYFKRTVQSITYLPHFISMVVICGMIVEFTSPNGFITLFLNKLGSNYTNLLYEPQLFKPIYIISDIWQGLGWGSIVYLAAISGLDSELYEAASIDGAKNFKQLIHVTLPGIAPTIVIMLILKIGRIMSLGADKIILLYNPSIYETSDVIASYIYRRGLIQSDYSFSTAIGLFNSVINCIMVYSANYISRKVSDSSLF